jgi:hypothetical protein
LIEGTIAEIVEFSVDGLTTTASVGSTTSGKSMPYIFSDSAAAGGGSGDTGFDGVGLSSLISAP